MRLHCFLYKKIRKSVSSRQSPSDSKAAHQIPFPSKRAVRSLRLKATKRSPLPREMAMADLGYSIAVKKPPMMTLKPQSRKEYETV